ncbi:hypothetical protein [Desulforegula conservatrix]|uniref:hypothetical protein n=1 Tax=Desulforegula conservatrix TaxID=153026 RepID=UPI000483C95C|nr:hypothetical protein [Desulforegula conservatrix]
MSCILRVYGNSLDIEMLLDQLELEPYQWWEKDELRVPNNPSFGVRNYSGANFIASKAKMHSFDTQVEETLVFLERNKVDILKITSFLGVEGADLDFSIALGDTYTHTDYLSPKFLCAVAKFGLGVSLSHYPTTEKDES